MSLFTSNTDTDTTTVSSGSTRTGTEIHGQSQNDMYMIRRAQLHDLPYLASIEKSAASAFISSSDPDLAPLADDEPIDSAVVRECAESWSQIDTFSRWNANADEVKNGLMGTWVAVAESNATPKHSMDSEMKRAKVVGFIVTSFLPVMANGTKKQSEGSLGGGKREVFIHIHEVSVHVEHQRRGLAKKLIGAVKECAAQINRRSGTKGNEGEKGDDVEEKRKEVEVLGLSLTTFRDVAFNAPFYRKLGFEEVEVDMIEEMVGREGMTIWEEEKHRFLGIGDGKLASRRCWMICKCGR